jgi:hypothetical protein
MFARDSWSSWKAYTPTFTAGTGVIGNGTVAGLWRRFGDSVEVMAELVVGSTTTFQAGQTIFLSLPNGYQRDPTKAVPTTNRIVGDFYCIDASTHANDSAGLPQAIPSSSNITGVAENDTGNPVTDTTPFTWATGDRLLITCMVPVTGL